ncbi:MAG: PAS domain-containing protein [Alphaproteobacteria bacterium]|nr:PAS domain-containing protein [Alphaproteobacteria bacterium]
MASVHRSLTRDNEQSVPSTEIVRNFPVWQSKSNDRPVYILHHGRPRSVLLSLDQYGELLAGLGSQNEREERLYQQLDTVLVYSPVMFIQVSRDLRVLRVNRTAAIHLGRSASELAEKPLENLFPPAHARKISETARKVIGTGMAAQLTMKSSVGVGHYYRLDIAPFPPGAAIFWSDVTHDTEFDALRAWRETQDVLLSMMTGCATGEIGEDGILAGVHASLRRLLRRRQESIAGIGFADLFDEESRRKCLLHVQHVMAGKGPVCCRADIITRDRGAVPIRLFLAPKMDGDDVASVLFTILDDSLGNLPMR